MSLQYLRHVITLAQEHEIAHQQLLLQLEIRHFQLHPSLRLSTPELSQEQQLQEFLQTYIRQVPNMLEAAEQMLDGSEIGECLQPALLLAESFFLEFNACDRAPRLIELLDKAYLAHRLIEEINDLYIQHMGLPLIPLSTTLANVVVHHLIGETQANQLDQRIQQLAAEVKKSPILAQMSMLAQQHNPERKVLRAWISWPCLSSEMGIQLNYAAARQPYATALPL